MRFKEDSKRCVAYLRVSTQDQSCEIQREEIKNYINYRGWVLIESHEDKATGTNGNRPQLQALLKAAKSRVFDVVVVWKLDRFFRSLKDIVTTLHEFTELGIEFISIKDQIDLTTSSGRLMTHMIAAFAEFEASLIKERVMAGLENAKRKGTILGRPKQIDESLAWQLRQQGFSLNQIAKRIGASKAGVYKTLSKLSVTNPVANPEIIDINKVDSVGHKTKV